MKRTVNLGNYARLIFVTVAIAVMVSGVTFAALQSKYATIKGSRIQTASANIDLSLNGNDFSSTLNGFNFFGILPGASPTASQVVYVRSSGTSNVALSVNITKMTSIASEVDMSKIYILVTPQGAGVTQKISFAEMQNSQNGVELTHSSTARLGAGSKIGLNLQISMDEDAMTGDSADLTDVDISFSGRAVL